MNKVGITRFNITDKISGSGSWRFRESRKYWATANTVLGCAVQLDKGEAAHFCKKVQEALDKP